MKVVKNKVAAPFREAEFDILYGEGISREGDLLDIAVNNNILEKSGSWFSYKGERIGQGRENARQFLKDNKDTMAKLDTEVRKALGLIVSGSQRHNRPLLHGRTRAARAASPPCQAPAGGRQGAGSGEALLRRRSFFTDCHPERKRGTLVFACAGSDLRRRANARVPRCARDDNPWTLTSMKVIPQLPSSLPPA